MYQGKKTIHPPYLTEGDKVALISPAYWVPQEALKQAAEIIREWGLQPVIGPNTNNLNVNAYAGTADERAADLKWALEDNTIKAVFCSRGGYGSVHLLNRIPQECFQQHPKWLIGHGDITVLLYAIMAGAGMMCIHGPMAFQIASSQEPASSLTRNILFGTLPQYHIPGNPYNRIGHAEGILVGGNLSSFSAIAGTKFHLHPKQDIILFIEEVEESLHAIDRFFYMLMLQMDFERVKGIIFGTFSSIKYDLQYGSVEQMLIAHLHELDIPICCGFPVGSNSCIPLIEGAPCSLDVVTDKAVLTFNMKGPMEPYEVGIANQQLIKGKGTAF
jgi:muramoyltetrapeptide carboxypeptidase